MRNPSLLHFLTAIIPEKPENANPAENGFRHFDGGKKIVRNGKLWTKQEGKRNRMPNRGQKQGGIPFSRQFIHNFREIFQTYTSYPLGMLVKAAKNSASFLEGRLNCYENLLGKYENLSEHIEVVKKNPDIYPTFAQQYTTENVQNNSLIVECGERSRFISYNDIYLYDANMSSYSYDVSFDGEGAITSAIDYVVNEDQPRIYLLEGHGEAELSGVFREQMEKENMELNSFSLLTADAIPEDADAILIYAPSSDISVEEKEMLAEYVSDGGKLMVAAGPTENGTLENLYSILTDYGVETADGIVVDTDRGHYAFQAPYVLLPDMADSDITNPLIEERYYAIMPISQGLIIQDTDNSAVQELLTTSTASYSKSAGYGLSSYEKEEGDTDGPFAVAVSVAAENEGQIIWFASSQFLDEMYNAYSSGGNLDLAMNALSSMIGENEAVAIRSKSLNYNYLTISDSAASLLKMIMIAIFPLAYLGLGICVAVGRRKWNEAK